MSDRLFGGIDAPDVFLSAGVGRAVSRLMLWAYGDSPAYLLLRVCDRRRADWRGVDQR